MEKENKNPEAIFIRNGIIEKVGTFAEVQYLIDKKRKIID